MILYYAFIIFPNILPLFWGERGGGEFMFTLKAWSAAHGFCVLPDNLPSACVSRGLTASFQTLDRSVLHSYQPIFETVFVSLDSQIWKKIFCLGYISSVSCRKTPAIIYLSCRNTFFSINSFQIILYSISVLA